MFAGVNLVYGTKHLTVVYAGSDKKIILDKGTSYINETVGLYDAIAIHSDRTLKVSGAKSLVLEWSCFHYQIQ